MMRRSRFCPFRSFRGSSTPTAVSAAPMIASTNITGGRDLGWSNGTMMAGSSCGGLSLLGGGRGVATPGYNQVRWQTAPPTAGGFGKKPGGSSAAAAVAKKKLDPSHFQVVDSQLSKVRNFGIVAHIDAGKTTTTERMLYLSGHSHRIGSVDEGSTTTDYLQEEMDRGITITAAAVSFGWKGHHINLIDTPGHVDFSIEVERSLRVLDGVVALFDAAHGVQAQSHTVLKQAKKYKAPVIAMINKMDKSNADWLKSIKSMEEKLNVEPLPIQVPLLKQDGEFEGVVDLVGKRSIRFGKPKVKDPNAKKTSSASGADVAKGMLREQQDARGDDNIEDKQPLIIRSVFEEASDTVELFTKYRHNLLNVLSRDDEGVAMELIELLDKYDGDEAKAEAEVSEEAIKNAIRAVTQQIADPVDITQRFDHELRQIVPVTFGATRWDLGVQPLIDAVCDYLPSPVKRAPVQGYNHNGEELTLPRTACTSNPDTDFLALAFKVIHVPEKTSGAIRPLTFFRVYSGRVTRGSEVLNINTGKMEKISQLFLMHANDPRPVSFVAAGHIGAAFLGNTSTGHSLFKEGVGATTLKRLSVQAKQEAEDSGLLSSASSSSSSSPSSIPKNIKDKLDGYSAYQKGAITHLEGIDIPPSVITFALEPHSAAQIAIVERALTQTTIEDPSLRWGKNELGTLTISGMGELHLEIAMSRLKREWQVAANLTRPLVEYRETLCAGSKHSEGSKQVTAPLDIGGVNCGSITWSVLPLRSVHPETGEVQQEKIPVTLSGAAAMVNGSGGEQQLDSSPQQQQQKQQPPLQEQGETMVVTSGSNAMLF